MNNITFLKTIALFLCFALLSQLTASVNAQSLCSASSTPATNGTTTAWAQNSLVSVNVNSNDFTRAEFDNCIAPVFADFNLANGATQEGYGNYSGVAFSVTYSPNAVATRDPSTGQASNASGISNGLQVNRDALADNVRGTTARGDNGTSRDSAVIRQNRQITNCQAIRENLAHEIGHTMGLGHCGETAAGNCDSGSSIMRRTECPSTMPAAQCLNSTEQGRTSPSQCDNQRVQQNSSYNPNTLNQPQLGGGGGGGDPGCTGGAGTESSCLADLMPDSCWNTEVCGSSSPILVDVAGNGFNLTDNANGVTFDLDGDGIREHLSWTVANSDDAWLALDRNNNGLIDKGAELFGNFTWQFWSQNPNGFLALAWFDRRDKGGNGDGVITSGDPVFAKLLLWQDRNHNGISEANELRPLASKGITTLELAYKESKQTDEYGNRFRYRAKVRGVQGTSVNKWAWDVFLVKSQ